MFFCWCGVKNICKDRSLCPVKLWFRQIHLWSLAVLYIDANLESVICDVIFPRPNQAWSVLSLVLHVGSTRQSMYAPKWIACADDITIMMKLASMVSTAQCLHEGVVISPFVQHKLHLVQGCVFQFSEDNACVHHQVWNSILVFSLRLVVYFLKSQNGADASMASSLFKRTCYVQPFCTYLS